MVYLAIFTFKIIEDALATLRLIVVSNGKKKLGAILQFVVTLIWIVLTSSVLIGMKDDIFKAVALAFGALFGSYLGSVLEEKIALGTNSFIVEVSLDNSFELIKMLEDKGFLVSRIKSYNDRMVILIVTGARKKSSLVVKIIKSFDKNAFILSEKVKVSL